MDFKGKLQEIYLDEEGSPKKLPFIITFGVVVSLILVINFLPSNKAKEVVGEVTGLDFGVPQEKEESTVQIEDDSKYITRKGFNKAMQKLSNQKTNGITTEQLQQILDQQQRNLIVQMREEREKEFEQLRENKKVANNTNKNVEKETTNQSNNINPNRPTNESYIDNDSSKINRTNKNKRINTSNNQNGSFNNESFNAPNNPYSSYPNNSNNQIESNQRYRQSNNQPNSNRQPMVGGSVMVSNFNNGGSVLVSNNPEKKDSGYSVKLGISSGTMIPSVLDIGLISSKDRSPAIVRVTKDIKYKGKVVIPKSAVFKGYAEADYGVRKMFVTLEKLIIGDREIDVKASLVKANGTPGFCSKYIDLQKRVHWYTTLAHFAAGVFNAFKDKTVVSGSNDDPVPQTYYDQNLKNAMIDGMNKGVEGWTDSLAQDAREQEAIILVNPRIETQVLIEEKINLNKFNSFK